MVLKGVKWHLRSWVPLRLLILVMCHISSKILWRHFRNTLHIFTWLIPSKPHQWPRGSVLKAGGREVPGSPPGRTCAPSRSVFSVVFSETHVNASYDPLERPPLLVGQVSPSDNWHSNQATFHTNYIVHLNCLIAFILHVLSIISIYFICFSNWIGIEWSYV